MILRYRVKPEYQYGLIPPMHGELEAVEYHERTRQWTMKDEDGQGWIVANEFKEQYMEPVYDKLEFC